MPPLMLAPGGSPEVIVDLSNVCRDDDLPPVGDRVTMRRLATVLKAWAAQHGGPPRGVAIADRSLRRHLTDSKERGILQRMIRDGLALEFDGADPEILRLAESRAAQVLSMDLYRGYRRQHPWIQGSTDRFVGWRPVAGGVELFERNMGVVSPFTISQHEERDDFMARGLRVSEPTDQDALRRAYRCGNPACLHTLLASDAVVPNRRHGRLVCSCGQPLEDVGQLPRAVEIIFYNAEREFGRLAIVAGERLEIGRDLLAGLVRDGLAADELDRMSRRHVELSLDDAGKLYARDLDSTNGSDLAHWDPSRKQVNPAKPLAAKVPVRVGRRDVLRLADVLQVRCSGRRFTPPHPRQIPTPNRDLKKTSHA